MKVRLQQMPLFPYCTNTSTVLDMPRSAQIQGIFMNPTNGVEMIYSCDEEDKEKVPRYFYLTCAWTEVDLPDGPYRCLGIVRTKQPRDWPQGGSEYWPITYAVFEVLK